jgi:hypothetical protein
MRNLDEFRCVVNKNISRDEFRLVTTMKHNNISESEITLSENQRYSYHITEVENNKYTVVRINKFGNKFKYYIYTIDDGGIDFDKMKSTKSFPETIEIPMVTGDCTTDSILFFENPNNYIFQHMKTTKYEMEMEKHPNPLMFLNMLDRDDYFSLVFYLKYTLELAKIETRNGIL